MIGRLPPRAALLAAAAIYLLALWGIAQRRMAEWFPAGCLGGCE